MGLFDMKCDRRRKAIVSTSMEDETIALAKVSSSTLEMCKENFLNIRHACKHRNILQYYLYKNSHVQMLLIAELPK